MKRAFAACAALLTGASLALVPAAATAAPKTTPPPGTVVFHKVGPVVEYEYFEPEPGYGEQSGRATIPISYTCYPVDPARPEVTMLVDLVHGYGTGWNRFEDDVFPCDGKKHRIEVRVNSASSFAPMELPKGKPVPGTVRILAIECTFCNVTVEPTTHAAPVKVKLIPAS
jgi:hypothetical protein